MSELNKWYPNALGYVEIAITNGAAVPLSSVPERARRALVQPNVTIRVRDDGVSPTTTVGIRVFPDAFVVLDEVGMDTAEFISESFANGILRVSFYGD